MCHASSRSRRRMFGDELTFGTQGLGIETEGARSAIDVLTLALWVVAAVVAVSGLVAIGIVLTRDIGQSGFEQPVLRGLGLTRRQRAAISGPRALVVAGGGAVITIVGAVALSPLFPIGVARRAEPDPGLHVDWTTLALGALVLIVVVLGIALLASIRQRVGFRSTATHTTIGALRPSSTGPPARAPTDRDERSADGNPVRERHHSDTGEVRTLRGGVRRRRRDGGAGVRGEPGPPGRHSSPLRLDLGCPGRCGRPEGAVRRPGRPRHELGPRRRGCRSRVFHRDADRWSSGCGVELSAVARIAGSGDRDGTRHPGPRTKSHWGRRRSTRCTRRSATRSTSTVAANPVRTSSSVERSCRR